jgi:hypothetical protein
LPIPVPGQGYFRGIAEDKYRDVGKLTCVGIAQVEFRFTRAEDTNGIDPIAVPIPGDGLIGGYPIIEYHIRKALVVAILQVKIPFTGTEDANGIDPIAIPISGDGDIAGNTQREAQIRLPGTVAQEESACPFSGPMKLSLPVCALT